MAFSSRVDNAAKYSAAGTTIRVRSGRENGSVYVQILDEGVGTRCRAQK